MQTSIRGAVAQGNDTGVLLEELPNARDVLRHARHSERKRAISRPLLVKGLEYDHVVIADFGDFGEGQRPVRGAVASTEVDHHPG